MELTRYNCFIGTARGFLLSTTEKPKELKHVKPEFSSEITALAFGKEQNEIIVGYQNGTLHRYNPSENIYLDTISDLEGEGGIVGLGCTDNVVIAGKSDGIINIWKEQKNKHFNINLDKEGTLNSMVLNESNRKIATGGEKNDLKLWDIETQQCVFKAKSMGHDKLNLPIPTSIRGISFFPGDPNLSCCCTKEGHVLVYDERKQRRPVVKFLETKASYTCISSAYREQQCLVGTTRGYMQLLDMKVGKSLKTFTTFTGSLTSIACDPLEPYVVSTSLDRHLRLHHLETKELLQKVYLKVNLTCLLIKPIVKEEKMEDDNNNGQLDKKGEVDDEYEDIFEHMEVVVDDKRKKKKHKKHDYEINEANVFENTAILVSDAKKTRNSKNDDNVFENLEVAVEGVKKKRKNKRIVEENNISVLESIEVVDESVTKKKNKRIAEEFDDEKQLVKRNKKKVKNIDDSNKLIKVKRRSTRVKNIFAK